MESSKNIYYYVAAAAVIIVLGLVILYFFGIKPSDLAKELGLQRERPQVVEETLVIPYTQKITGTEGRTASPSSVAVPLVPKSDAEKVIVEKAVLTVKGSYDLAKSEAENWSSSAKLVFVKSLGAVTLEGKSSQWQLAFSSALKPKKGYEVIIQADDIVSKKEIDASAAGANIPKNWYDSDGAIKSLQELPQFADATVSGINFFFNQDGKTWMYGLTTSRGATSMTVE